MYDMEYELKCCPQCHQGISTTTNRLIQDSCGHKKCRMCLLQEDKGCVACENVSRYENYGEIAEDNLQSCETQVSVINTSYRYQRHNTDTVQTLHHEKLIAEPTEIYTNVKEERRPELQTIANLVTHNVLDEPEHLTPAASLPEPPTPVTKQDGSISKPSANSPSTKSPASRSCVKVKKKRKPMVVPSYVTVSKESPPNYTCTICKKTFKARLQIRYHLYCDGKEKPFKCEVCSQQFISKSHFEYHLRNHDGTRPYVCTVCKKAFNQQGKLTRHLFCHSKERKFICSTCGRAFKDLDGLRSHQRTHSDEKAFKCSSCSKKFSVRAKLKQHSITHTGEKNFMCDECGKSFSLKCALSLHIMTHSAAHSNTCKVCYRAFTAKKDLKRHLITHSESRPFACPVCNFTFRRKDNYRRHMRNNHPGSNLPLIIVTEAKVLTDDNKGSERSTASEPSVASENISPQSQTPVIQTNENTNAEPVSTVNNTCKKDNSVIDPKTSDQMVKEPAVKSTPTHVIQQLDKIPGTDSQNNDAARPLVNEQQSRKPIITVAGNVETLPTSKSPNFQTVSVINRSNSIKAPESPLSSGIIKMNSVSEVREPANCVRTITSTSDLQKSEVPKQEPPKLRSSCGALGPELLGDNNPEKPTLKLYLSDVHWRKRIMELLNLKREPSTNTLIFENTSSKTSDGGDEKQVTKKSRKSSDGNKSSSGDGVRKSGSRSTHAQKAKHIRSQCTNVRLVQKVPEDTFTENYGHIVPTKEKVPNVEYVDSVSNASSDTVVDSGAAKDNRDHSILPHTFSCHKTKFTSYRMNTDHQIYKTGQETASFQPSILSAHCSSSRSDVEQRTTLAASPSVHFRSHSSSYQRPRQYFQPSTGISTRNTASHKMLTPQYSDALRCVSIGTAQGTTSTLLQSQSLSKSTSSFLPPDHSAQSPSGTVVSVVDHTNNNIDLTNNTVDCPNNNIDRTNNFIDQSVFRSPRCQPKPVIVENKSIHR